jgi:hypothetical protein
MTEPTYTLEQIMEMICYTRHSKSSQTGKKPYTKRESLLNGFGRACKLFKATHGDDRLRDEYVRRRKSNSLTREFLDRIFPYFPSVTSCEGKPLKVIDYSLATTEATKPTVPPIDLAYTARVVEASERRELEKELAAIYATIDAIDLNSDPFPVDLGEAALWLGYSGEARKAKSNAKALLTVEFMEGVDYVLRLSTQTQNTRGGHNAEQIRLTSECFKKFCLRAGTKRAERVREYFILAEQRFRAAFTGDANAVQVSSNPEHLENLIRRVSWDEAGQQLTAAMDEIGENLGSVEVKVLTRLEAMQQFIEQQIDALKNDIQERVPENKRRQFPLPVQKRVGRLFYEFTRGGGCLGNRHIQVIDANGDKISPMQFDHWDGNESRNVYDNCVPMSLELHRRKTAGRLTAEERKRIEAFIDWMRMIEDDTEETQLGLSIF